MVEKTLEQIRSESNLKLEAEITNKIINTLKQLPDEVYEYVIRNVQFEKAMGCCYPLPEIKKSFLILVEENASEKTIAQQIAHAYLKHPAYMDISIEQAEKFKEDALSLCEKWLKKL